MKTFFLVGLLSLAFGAGAQDRKFQFYYQNGKYFYYAAYESVRFYDSDNRLIQSNVTDKYGRMTAKLPAGRYLCKVRYQKQEYSFWAYIDNQYRLRKVYFRDRGPAYIQWGSVPGSANPLS